MSTANSVTQPPQADAVERRGGPRRTCRLRVALGLPDGSAMSVASIDISREGMAMLLPRPLPPGTECTVGFSIYADGAIRRIEAAARVLNSVFLRQDVRVGFAFTRIAPDHQRLLANFVG